MHNPEFVLDTQNSQGFLDTNGSSNLSQTVRPCDSQEKKGTCRIVDFAVPADYRIKMKESGKRNKYLDLARELKKTIKQETYGNRNCN